MRILAIDYGLKRTGLAWTDPLQIIATPLEGCDTAVLLDKLRHYITTGAVEVIVVGMPRRLNGTDTHATAAVRNFIKTLAQHFPNVKVVEIDERFTSALASQALYLGGASRKQRHNKHQINATSATLILQTYLAQQSSR